MFLRTKHYKVNVVKKYNTTASWCEFNNNHNRFSTNFYTPLFYKHAIIKVIIFVFTFLKRNCDNLQSWFR